MTIFTHLFAYGIGLVYFFGIHTVFMISHEAYGT